MVPDQSDREAVQSSGGFRLQPDGGLDYPEALDAVVVVASLNIADFHEPQVFRRLRQQAGAGCEIGAVGTASRLLARAGLLKGYKFTIHWEVAQDLMEEFPDLSRVRFITCWIYFERNQPLPVLKPEAKRDRASAWDISPAQNEMTNAAALPIAFYVIFVLRSGQINSMLAGLHQINGNSCLSE